MSSPADSLQQLLASLPPDGPLDLFRFLEAVYATRFTGPYTVHNRNGVPHQIDLGAPVKLSIVQAERPPGRKQA